MQAFATYRGRHRYLIEAAAFHFALCTEMQKKNSLAHFIQKKKKIGKRNFIA